MLLSKKFYFFFTPLALNLLSCVASAENLVAAPPAHPPFHLKSTIATLAPSGISPAQIRTAYGFPSSATGAGQTIAIVDAYDDPNIEADLNVFSSQYGLPSCTTANGCFKKIYSAGTQPTGDTGWGMEISLDVEWVHAIAPAAKIILIEAPNNSGGLYSAVTTAINSGATAISLSWGGSEFNGETSYDNAYFKNSPVPIFVSSGDAGAGVLYPAASPYVIAVGGTQITLDSSGNYQNESAWSGSGGGLSVYESEPAFQKSYAIPQNTGFRGVPDVAYNASPSSGFSVYDSYGQGGWLVIGGTSAGAPQWAAMIADINSTRSANLGNMNAPIYTAATLNAASLFHDVTSGQNGTCGYVCQAHAGYDYVTGLGTPKFANLLSYFSNACLRGNPTVTFSPTTQTTPAGGGVSYGVSVKNNDSTVCGSSTYALTSAIPNGLAGGLSSSNVLLAPGATSALTLQVNSTASTAAASYNISATATNSAVGSSTSTATGTYVVTGVSQQSYAYIVYVGYPFNKVLINNSIECGGAGGNPACLVPNQNVGGVMLITGTNNDKCSMSVQANGNLLVNLANSVNCNVGITPATTKVAGSIAMPSGF